MYSPLAVGSLILWRRPIPRQFWSRFANVFRDERLSREIDVEMESHIAEALSRGRDASEARRSFGSALRHRGFPLVVTARKEYWDIALTRCSNTGEGEWEPMRN